MEAPHVKGGRGVGGWGVAFLTVGKEPRWQLDLHCPERVATGAGMLGMDRETAVLFGQ